MDNDQIELENRIKNLMWTVSGDYTLNIKPDVESFQKSKYISLYDAVKQGAFAKYYNIQEFSMYLMKKIYLGADENQLMRFASLCIDEGIYKKVTAERAGVENIRKRAFADILEYDFARLSVSLAGRIEIAVMRKAIEPDYRTDKRTMDIVKQIMCLEESKDTLGVIKTLDDLYNRVIDPYFEKKHGTLESVFNVTLDELKEFDWKDYMEEEIYEDMIAEMMEEITAQVTSMSSNEKKNEITDRQQVKQKVIVIDDEAIAKLYSYIELNYGKSYLTPLEQKQINYNLCRGAHSDCTLYFTDGILLNPVKRNYQYAYVQRQVDKNKKAYAQNHRITKRNIQILTDMLRRSLILRNEVDIINSNFGVIRPNVLWKVGRASAKNLFLREIRQNDSDFVVDILIDASGSQRSRQEKVALQGYIISESLTKVKIPHRVMSFCSFWDYTVMHRLREYDEGPEANSRIFHYTTSSNNRDGLAIRAAVAGLSMRPEENKILIVLSDGKPNDVKLNRPGSKNPRFYSGEYAVRDTAFEVRKTRNMGISVLGVFAGEEKDLLTEKKIFGKDFAYIREITSFSNVVGTYLKRQLDETL